MQHLDFGTMTPSSSTTPVQQSDETKVDLEINPYARMRFHDELKPFPLEDGGYWQDKCVKLEARFAHELNRTKDQILNILAENNYLKAEGTRKDLTIGQLELQVKALQHEKQLLKEVITPYIDQIMENITKSLIIELGKHPDILAELRKWIAENQDNKVVSKVQDFLAENDSACDRTALDYQLQKLHDLCQLFQLKEPALVEDLPSTSYLQIAGLGAGSIAGFAWSGLKIGGSLSYWIFKQLIPVLTFGLSSTLLMNNAWLPVVRILINGARIVYG